MKFFRLLAVLLLITAGTAGYGCGGGGAKVETKTQNTSLGQELTDLKKAYDAGIINKKEYDSAKKSLQKKFK